MTLLWSTSPLPSTWAQITWTPSAYLLQTMTSLEALIAGLRVYFVLFSYLQRTTVTSHFTTSSSWQRVWRRGGGICQILSFGILGVLVKRWPMTSAEVSWNKQDYSIVLLLSFVTELKSRTYGTSYLSISFAITSRGIRSWSALGSGSPLYSLIG